MKHNYNGKWSRPQVLDKAHAELHCEPAHQATEWRSEGYDARKTGGAIVGSSPISRMAADSCR